MEWRVTRVERARGAASAYGGDVAVFVAVRAALVLVLLSD